MFMHESYLLMYCSYFNIMKLRTSDPNLHLSLVDTTFCFFFLLVCLLSCLFACLFAFLLSCLFVYLVACHVSYHIDENQQAFKDPLHVPAGPITKARSKKIKEALNGLIQEIWANSSAGHSKLGPKKDEGVINLIQAIEG